MAVSKQTPFRAQHVGSLLRPPALAAARQARRAGTLSREDLGAIEDAAIVEAVRLQEEIGFECVSDGEFRRDSWHLDFLFGISGTAESNRTRTLEFRSAGQVIPYTFSPLRIVDRISLGETVFGEDFSFLKSVAKKTPKISIPSPSMLHVLGGHAAIDPVAYPEIETFYAEIAPVYRKQIAGLAALGCEQLQLDDTRIPFLTDPEQRRLVEETNDDPKRHLRMYIDHFNDAIADRPDGMTITTHMCRGNFRSAWAASGAYDYVAESLFGGLKVDGFLLEFDDERSGGFESLRFVPPGTTVVLGLVTTKSPRLETKDLLKRRIDEASKFVPLNQLCLSPQCGFASTAEGNDLTIEQQAAKLRLVVEVAREVWG